jgi:hypothetical protein
MQKRAKILFLWVILFSLVSLTACSSNSENRELAKKACSALSVADKKEVVGDFYAEPSLKTDYLKAKVLFDQLSKNESGSKEDLERIFRAYANSIDRWANGVRYDYAHIAQVYWFCGPNYVSSSIRYYPDQAITKKYIEEYLGIEVPQTSSENRESFYEASFDWRPIIAIMIFVIYLFAVYWIGLTAKRAGRSFFGWLLLGMVVPPIAGIIVLTFKPENKLVESLKRCPYCAESIQLEAKFCRFCSKEISFT